MVINHFIITLIYSCYSNDVTLSLSLYLSLTGAIAFNGSQFGPGNSQYLVQYTDVTCTGHETTLRGCQLRTTNATVCPHSRDAGVKCLKGPGWYSYTYYLATYYRHLL